MTIAYRRRLIDAPSYTLNHEEVAKALEEGIRFAECLTPEEVEARSLRLTRARCGSASQAAADTDPGAPPLEVVLPARTILVAAGTQPNTVLGREDAAQRRSSTARYFQAVDEDGQPVKPRADRQADRRARADVACGRTAAPSASSAICIRRSPATW